MSKNQQKTSWTILFYLRNIDEAITLANKIKSAKQATVIGGGFVGLEVISVLKKRKIPTTLILRNRYFWHKLFDNEANKFIHNLLERHNIKIKTDVRVVKVGKAG